MMHKPIVIIFILLLSQNTFAQPVPHMTENMDFLVTLGKDSQSELAEKAYSQSIYFSIPKEYNEPVFIRIFDADIGGENDIAVNGFNSQVKYEIFGGRTLDLSGTENTVSTNKPISEKILDTSEVRDNKWWSLDVFIPSQGYYDEQADSYVFKLLVSGLSGDDINCYRVYLSASPADNIPIEGGAAFRYHTTCLLKPYPETGHTYPYFDNDYDNISANFWGLNFNGNMKVISYAAESTRRDLIIKGKKSFKISAEQLDAGICMDFQFNSNPVTEKSSLVLSYEMLGDGITPLMHFTPPIG